MPFNRVWDATCPKDYDRWEAEGTTWVIQDLPPEDDEEALKMLVEHLIPDEALCMASGLLEDQHSLEGMADFWRLCLAKRTSLACYAHKDGTKQLVALNCCIVVCADDDKESKFEGKAFQNVYNALQYTERKVKVFELLDTDVVLCASGLVVRREYRGAKLGARILAAREPLCAAQGIKGTSTVFTVVASQKSAERAGFRAVAEVSFKELADAGMLYPADDRVIKLMVKKFDS